jgi:hypothetical protein
MTSMFEIEDESHGVKTRLGWKTGPLGPEKYADHFKESSWVPCCDNASSKSFIQSIMIHRWKLGSLD